MSEQTIFRRAHVASFVAVSNTLARDASLSHQARGLLLWLLSYPTDWDVKIDALVTPSNTLKAVRKIVQELEDAGYVCRKRERDAATGRMGRTVFTVYEDALPAEQRSGAERRNRKSPHATKQHVVPHAQNGHVGEQPKTGKKSPHAQNPHGGKRPSTKTDNATQTETITKTAAVVVVEGKPNVFTAYEQQFGMLLSPGLADTLRDMAAEYGETWVIDALSITATAGKRGNLRYTDGILRRWKAEGRETEQAKPSTVVIDELTAWRAAQKARPNVRVDPALDLLLPAFKDEDDRRRYIVEYLRMDYAPLAAEEWAS